MSGVDFDAAVDELEECIERCGDTIANPVQTDQARTIGFIVERNSWTYIVHGDPDGNEHQFTVEFRFGVSDNIANLLEPADVRDLLSLDSSTSINEQHLEDAAIEVLDSMRPANQEKFRYHLLQEICDSNTSHRLIETPGGGVEEFRISGDVYPDSPGFTQTEFARTVRSVTSVGIRGIQFVATAFDFESVVDSQLDTEPPNLRYIQ